jgi:hypothetical protein
MNFAGVQFHRNKKYFSRSQQALSRGFAVSIDAKSKQGPNFVSELCSSIKIKVQVSHEWSRNLVAGD